MVQSLTFMTKLSLLSFAKNGSIFYLYIFLVRILNLNLNWFFGICKYFCWCCFNVSSWNIHYCGKLVALDAFLIKLEVLSLNHIPSNVLKKRVLSIKLLDLNKIMLKKHERRDREPDILWDLKEFRWLPL